MKAIGKLGVMLIGAALSLTGATAVLAQGGYNQPYDTQPGYGQPGYNQQYYGQPGGPESYQDFYDQLGPYGQWVRTPEYGNVWIPDVEPGFQPYATNGHWVVTEYGNTWVSDYAWGWGPFHYGRWYMDRYRGWAWVPGNDWGPAWVSWRSGGGYYGWAPLGPGVNINVNATIPLNYWVFVPQVYITSPNIYSYYIPGRRLGNIYQNSVYINNIYRSNNRVYAYGPRREEIEYVTRRSVPVYRIENSGRPGRSEVRGNSVGIYRPDMNRSSRGSGSPYGNDQRSNSRQSDYGVGATGDYGGSGSNRNNGGYSRSNPAYGSQRYQQPDQYPQRQSMPDNRGRRYERQTQPDPPTQPSGQAYPQRGQQESYPQGSQQREWGRRQGPASQQSTTEPTNSQPQEQRGYEQRGQGQPQTVPQGGQGSSPERRGGSRGPR